VTEKEPMILIGGPITEHKLYCTSQFLGGLKNLTYKNKVVVLIDNSPTNSVREAICNFDAGCQFYIITTQYRTYARERLVEGRNLLRAIILKEKNLEKFELSYEDEQTVKELQKMDFNYFFSIEQDVIPPVDVIEKLLACKKEIVQGVYMNQKVIDVPAVINTPQGQHQFTQQQTKYIPMAWNYPNDAITDVQLLIDVPMEQLFPSRVFRIAASGVGCILMTKKVLEDLHSSINVSSKFKKILKEEKVLYNGNIPEEIIINLKEKFNYLITDIKNSFSINNRGGNTRFIEEEIEDNNHKYKIIKEVITDGFRYDQTKYACDDMFFSLDSNYAGHQIFMNTYLWCEHLHQVWDNRIIGER